MTEEGTKVVRALFHQPVEFTGGVEKSMYSHKGFNMVYKTDGLHVEYKTLEFIVPAANIVAVYKNAIVKNK